VTVTTVKMNDAAQKNPRIAAILNEPVNLSQFRLDRL
jgi:hypothetical protein